MSRCSWLSDGEQCHFPGTRSDGLKGDGRWLCCHHFREPDVFVAAEIVERSARWAALPNRAEAWVESRKASVYASESPAVKALRERLKPPRDEPTTSPLAKWLPAPMRQPGEDLEEAAE